MKARSVLLIAICALCLSTASWADDLLVYVGYADGLRGSPTFPNPWVGDPGIIAPNGAAGPYDAGAIMLVNNSGAPISIDSVVYSSNGWFYNGVNLWGTFVIGVGEAAILTQNFSYNFDTSEAYGASCCSNMNPGVFPTIDVTISGGSTLTFNDTALVTTTGNFDLAGTGRNEALGWRLIGTTGIEDPNNHIVPEPSSMLLAGTGLVGLLRRRFRKSA